MDSNHAERHRFLLTTGLLLLSPLVGEFLLGNQPITALPSLILLAPMYGGGALLIREGSRRAGRGWPTMILLAAAYALIEEGPIDQMLWNPHYGGTDMGAAYASTHVAFLGTSIQLVQDVLALHTVWSICVPIAIIETFSRDRTRPWLGKPGLAVIAAVFVAGSSFLAVDQIHSEHFIASPVRFAQAAAAIAALIVAAIVISRRPVPRVEASAPRPWVVGTVAFAASSLYFACEGITGASPAIPWLVVGAGLLLAGGAVALATRWSHRRDWGAAHRLALAGGALLTYVWLGFTQGQAMSVPHTTAVIGPIILGAAAVILLGLAARALSVLREPQRAAPAPARSPGEASSPGDPVDQEVTSEPPDTPIHQSPMSPAGPPSHAQHNEPTERTTR
jgi:hypothetical protein